MLVRPFYCEEFIDYIYTVFGHYKYTEEAIKTMYNQLDKGCELDLWNFLINKKFIENTYFEFTSYRDVIDYLYKHKKQDYNPEDIYNKEDSPDKIEDKCRLHLKVMSGYYDYVPLKNKNILLIL